MTTVAQYFLSAPSSVVNLETFILSHPSFSRTYAIVRNHGNGITATLEDNTTQTFEYQPVQIEMSQVGDNLDFSVRVSMGDLGEIVARELENVAVADTRHIKPTFTYRTFRSDDLTRPLSGVLRLEMDDISTNRRGATFVATAPVINNVQTGEIYSITRFPSLVGFLYGS